MESPFIDWLRDRAPSGPAVRMGIGDDAAILKGDGPDLVVATDMLMDGVHFHLSETSPQLIGRKSLAVNLSDMAAMAARPQSAFLSLALPDGRSPNASPLQLAKSLSEGMIALAEEFDITIAGGDTNVWSGPLVVNVAVTGELTEKGPLLRSGARPSDWILVTGSVGGRILGRHYSFPPRVREALLLHSQFELHAAMDISDGLSLDLSRMAEQSRCGAVLYPSRIPIAADAVDLAKQCPENGSPLDHAFFDGEDFELILAASAEEAQRILSQNPLEAKLTCIGRFIEQQGLWQESPSGDRAPLPPRGYLHGES